MLKILVILIALSKQLDIYLLTDGPGWTSPDADYEKLNWKRAKSWIEFLFDRSAVLEQAQTNLYFISRYSYNLILPYILFLLSKNSTDLYTQKRRVRHCSGGRTRSGIPRKDGSKGRIGCRSRIQHLPYPGSNTFAALKTLSDHIALENSNKDDTKILFFITGKKTKIIWKFLRNRFQFRW